MKSSLEEQRHALLEQIEASRAVYRRMLSEANASSAARRPIRQGRLKHQAHVAERTMQWMMDHPWYVAGGVALIVLLAPRLIGAVKRPLHETPDPGLGSAPQHPTGTRRALLTAGALLLRDPARMHAVARLLQSAWQWMRQQRAAASSGAPSAMTRSARLD